MYCLPSLIVPLDSPLPLIPNVTIQYRCGDNIGFGKTRYGLLPFSTYTNSNRINKVTARYIYVIADRFLLIMLLFFLLMNEIRKSTYNSNDENILYNGVDYIIL